VRFFSSVLATVVGVMFSAGRGNTDSTNGTPSPADFLPVTAADLRVDTLASELKTPWDLTWGPDSVIWMSERSGAISRLEPATGKVTQVGSVPAAARGEAGLLGLAIHPDWKKQPYIYVMYSFARDGAGKSRIGNRLVRLPYANGKLGPEEILLDTLAGAGIHNGSRLAIGPDRLLYVTTGDAADAAGLPQDRELLGGKILRLTLDGKPAPGNPFNNYVYTYGHRNPQGLIFHPRSGLLYSSEHGPSSDDEVNLVLAGRNYGWPAVKGFCDSPEEQVFCREHNVAEPLVAWTPTIAIAGIDVYDADLIRGWRGSLLVASLKGTLYRLTLSADGTAVVAQESLFAGEFPRFRDILVGPRGEVYLATRSQILRLTPR
jgi:glucose/arabinose dehydrogenase